jgi:CheY-like chemotaxis protein
VKSNFETLRNLIIADDDEDDQLLLQEIISDYSSQINTTTIPDGKKLMEHLADGKVPDLLLLDLNMPYKTGMECLSEIRSDKKLKKIPVVVLTTSKNKNDIDRCYMLGAHLFYSKPYDIESFKELIHSLLEIDWQVFERPSSKEEFAQIALEGKLLQ